MRKLDRGSIAVIAGDSLRKDSVHKQSPWLLAAFKH
jgi:hypothetical protein